MLSDSSNNILMETSEKEKESSYRHITFLSVFMIVSAKITTFQEPLALDFLDAELEDEIKVEVSFLLFNVFVMCTWLYNGYIIAVVIF